MTQVTTEVTPNPAAMKFVLEEYIFRSGESVLFSSKNSTLSHSLLAEELFQFPFVKEVFIAANFITVSIRSSSSWDLLIEEMRAYIADYIDSGKKVVSKLPELEDEFEELGESALCEANPLDVEIKRLLDSRARPAVERDGGRIDYIGFKEGTVYLQLKGACAGCPGAASTLKFGIENMLKQELTKVKTVVAVNG